MVPSASSLVSLSIIPAELVKIAAAWDGVPQAVRAGIIAMIEASTTAPKDDAVRERPKREGN